MEKFKLGGAGPDLKSFLGASEVLYPAVDELANEYLVLLWAHPGFQKARRELQEEFNDLEEDGIFLESDEARRGPEEAPYPLSRFGKEWGISPAAAYALARPWKDFEDLDEDELFNLYRREARAIIIWELTFGFTLFVPRPVTGEQTGLLSSWLANQKSGQFESLWGRSGKTRWQPNPAHIEALPWFKEWVDGRPPTEIWKERQAKNPKLDHNTFVQQISRLRERMREISPDEIPATRPSKAKS